MKKSPNYIKKTLDEIKLELLKDKKLQLSRQLYVQKLKEIFNEQVIDLKDGVETRMSSTGTDKTVAVSSTNDPRLPPILIMSVILPTNLKLLSEIVSSMSGR